MSENIKVSVLTPIYNHKIEYVEKCLESLKNQTMQDIEFILIDNGATQESKDLIEKYLQLDSRFRALHLIENGGYAGAMNLGFDNAKGEYIGIVESDDWVDATMFNDLYNLAVKNNVQFVKSAYYEEYEEKSKITNIFQHSKLDKKIRIDVVKEFLNFHASPWSILYKKSLLDNNIIRISGGTGNVAKDLGLVIKAFLSAKEIYITSKPYYHYNLYNSNQSMKISNMDYVLSMLFREYDNIYTWFNDKVQKNILPSEYRAYIDKRLFVNVDKCFKSKVLSKGNMDLISEKLLENIKNTDNFANREKKILEILQTRPMKYYKDVNMKNENSFLENIFSITNTLDRKHKVVTILGLQLKFKRDWYKSNYQRLYEEIQDLKELVYQSSYLPQKVAILHQKVFPQFHNIHNQDSVVIVGCGSTMSYYRPMKGCYHISLNRAIRRKEIKFDYAFIWDLLSMNNEDPEFMHEFLDYDCIKFVGQFLNDARNVPMDLNMEYRNKLYRCYSASRNGFPLETCDSVIHQDISIFPLADFMSISFGALNFATYTHPKKIYLVGLDTQQSRCFDGRQHVYRMDEIMMGYQLFQRFIAKYYPDVEVISINPVGLKGMFKDVYTKNYVDEHPELLKDDIEILEEEKELVNV